MNIRHLNNKDIDKSAWDNAIMHSHNFVPYALSWYLDVVCPSWEALISGDYQYIMPLPIKRKWGVKYLVQPLWVQQLGVFSSQDISEGYINNFIDHIPYNIYAFNLNEGNYTPKYCSARKNLNLCLDLSTNYEQLSTNFNSNTKRNIKKAQREGIEVEPISNDMFYELWVEENAQMSAIQKNMLHNLMSAAIANDSSLFLGAFAHNTILDDESNTTANVDNEKTLVAALFALEFDKRIYYLAPVSNAQGMCASAMFLIVNELIESNAGTTKILDFEGSMIDGVARFYRGFGANTHYYFPISRLYPEKLLKSLHNLL